MTVEDDLLIAKDKIIIEGLPMPPSSNHQYATITRKGKSIRIPSKEVKAFKKQMQEWALEHREVVEKAKEWLKNKYQIQLERHYCLHRSKLWTKDYRLKKLDVTNRIKAFDDCLCEMMGFDDSQIWLGQEEKISIPDNIKECVIVILKPAKPRSLSCLILDLKRDILF